MYSSGYEPFIYLKIGHYLLRFLNHMKGYKFYKKVEPVNYNIEELLSYIVLPLIIASYISYPVLYFLGVEVTIVFNIILAFLANYFYKGLKKFMPNFTINSKLEIINAGLQFVYFLIVLIVLMTANFGFYLLVNYQKNNEFNIYYFYLWVLILFGTPLIYFGIKFGMQYYEKQRQAIDFLKIFVTINHDAKLLLFIQNIQFINTHNRKSSDIHVKNNIRYYSYKEFLSIQTKTRNYYANKEGFREAVQIPFGTNLLLISWFSFDENKLYELKIPFPFEEIIKEPEKHCSDNLKIFRGKEVKQLHFNLYLKGGINVFFKNKTLLGYPENKGIVITEEYKKTIMNTK